MDSTAASKLTTTFSNIELNELPRNKRKREQDATDVELNNRNDSKPTHPNDSRLASSQESPSATRKSPKRSRYSKLGSKFCRRQKRYRCRYCRSDKLKKECRKHWLIRMKGVPYKCHACGMTFDFNSFLMNHIQRFHDHDDVNDFAAMFSGNGDSGRSLEKTQPGEFSFTLSEYFTNASVEDIINDVWNMIG